MSVDQQRTLTRSTSHVARAGRELTAHVKWRHYQTSFRRFLQSKSIYRVAPSRFLFEKRNYTYFRKQSGCVVASFSQPCQTTLQILVEWRRIKAVNDHTAGHWGRKDAAAAASLSRRSLGAEKLPGDLSGTKHWQTSPEKRNLPVRQPVHQIRPGN